MTQEEFSKYEQARKLDKKIRMLKEEIARLEKLNGMTISRSIMFVTYEDCYESQLNISSIYTVGMLKLLISYKKDELKVLQKEFDDL